MQALNLPAWPFKIVKDKGKYEIFDPVRRKYLTLTPEEWVRQHVVRFLIDHRGFPAGLLQTERQVKHHQRKGRYDAMFRDRRGNPLVLIECKAPSVRIDETTFAQISRYNSALQVPYWMLSNGMVHFFGRVIPEEGRLEYMEGIPDYSELSGGGA